jgi:hypothetical protein
MARHFGILAIRNAQRLTMESQLPQSFGVVTAATIITRWSLLAHGLAHGMTLTNRTG